jgi:hypothetical protein
MAKYYHRWGGRSMAKHGLSTVPKLCPKISQEVEKSIKTSKNIVIRKGGNFAGLQGEVPYFFRFLPFLRNLQTVEVTGSNPVSPTTFYLFNSLHNPMTSQSQGCAQMCAYFWAGELADDGNSFLGEALPSKDFRKLKMGQSRGQVQTVKIFHQEVERSQGIRSSWPDLGLRAQRPAVLLGAVRAEVIGTQRPRCENML